MAKKEITAAEVKALDNTNLSWYSKAGSNKITFCNSIEDIINGKGRTLEFKERIASTKAIMKDGKTNYQQNLIVFILSDNKLVIVRRHDELK
ncbi:MAG: hypothetical protein FWD14_01970 [Treponema sp.]|nr:hypothetical protein [Treponema sp.]